MSNAILELKGSYERKGAMPPGPSLPKGQSVSLDHLEELRTNLWDCKVFWERQRIGIDYLINARYISTVAKSNRCKRLLAKNSDDASDSIVGARFEQVSGSSGKNLRHIITYRVAPHTLDKTIYELDASIDVLREHFPNAIITSDLLSKLAKNEFDKFGSQISKTAFAQIIRDSYYLVSFFYTDSLEKEYSTEAFVSLYDTGEDTLELLRRVIPELDGKQVFQNCVRLYPDQYESMRREAPFLIAMSTCNLADCDLRELWGEDGYRDYEARLLPTPSIPRPDGEPVIGVIDTLFNEDVYFSEWVVYRDYMTNKRDLNVDVAHGTQVSSIIVDGPSLNPELDDGCGRFRVKHFGVTDGEKMNSLTLMRDVKKIVEANLDIKVWNLSLGTISECPENSISPVASILDELQAKYDVVFVVSGTNLQDGETAKRIRLFPADSINSIVVNSVGRNGRPATYSRHGPVLSFFGKPDISYYGGTLGAELVVAAPYALVRACGTSYAAPWIARKLAFLIYKARLTREEAKALLIDTAYNWGEHGITNLRGYGVPPIRMEIVSTHNNEIRFMLSGTIDTYETYNYGIPIPLNGGKYPFMARATLCYFPECHRSQGVDYTTTEIDLHFGRIKGTGIKSLDRNTQGDEGSQLFEADARALFRKWDNVKHIGDVAKSRFAPRKAYDNPQWGIMLRKKERNKPGVGAGIRFAVVVTLREMYNVNRIEEFVQHCSLRGWIVNRIDIDVINKIYAAAEVDIEFED